MVDERYNFLYQNLICPNVHSDVFERDMHLISNQLKSQVKGCGSIQ
jgi:hypothetical protein